MVFSETISFGLRIDTIRRKKLQRGFRQAETPFGPVRIKAERLGGEAIRESPEFEDCRAFAEKHGVPALKIFNAALGAL